ncbi:hypothetical protein N657DRAFT_183375 [Parathielavia appendiculata]|uniref:Uncharacterized protein n=1 Tax=Parathielavia appendiculata TaxID=2587402 RepID=A0AAN6Z6L5_9PEZI|nr:hypothetical protein N657DRAFT_183375 [Parathielavia appendiculata]
MMVTANTRESRPYFELWWYRRGTRLLHCFTTLLASVPYLMILILDAGFRGLQVPTSTLRLRQDRCRPPHRLKLAQTRASWEDAQYPSRYSWGQQGRMTMDFGKVEPFEFEEDCALALGN